jgi:hypothetical protein
VTPEQLLEGAQARGILLWREGEGLAYRLPATMATNPQRRQRDLARADTPRLDLLPQNLSELPPPHEQIPSDSCHPMTPYCNSQLQNCKRFSVGIGRCGMLFLWVTMGAWDWLRYVRWQARVAARSRNPSR